jgi:hypothetical protein
MRQATETGKKALLKKHMQEDSLEKKRRNRKIILTPIFWTKFVKTRVELDWIRTNKLVNCWILIATYNRKYLVAKCLI